MTTNRLSKKAPHVHHYGGNMGDVTGLPRSEADRPGKPCRKHLEPFCVSQKQSQKNQIRKDKAARDRCAMAHLPAGRVKEWVNSTLATTRSKHQRKRS